MERGNVKLGGIDEGRGMFLLCMVEGEDKVEGFYLGVLNGVNDGVIGLFGVVGLDILDFRILVFEVMIFLEIEVVFFLLFICKDEDDLGLILFCSFCCRYIVCFLRKMIFFFRIVILNRSFFVCILDWLVEIC